MKTAIKKLCIWCVTVILLFVTCLLPYLTQNVFAVTAGDAVIYMDNAAKVQEVASTFKKCVNMATTDSSVSALYYFGNYFNGSNMFGNNKTNMNTGAWLENTVQGKVDNGQIWCQNNDSNIAKVFANTMGVSSWQNLVCNGDKPGMMTLQVYTLVNPEKDIYQWKSTDSACNIGFGNGDYKFAWRSNADAMAYVKQLYENYKASNPEVAKYLPAWDDLGNFSDKRVAYFSYLNDFKAACTDGTVYSGDLALMNQSNYFPPIKEVNPSTGVLEEVYYKKSVSKNNWDNSIVGSGGAHTCDTVVAKINEYADTVAQEAGAIVEEAIKEAEEAARERSKERCKALALYASVDFDSDGNIISKNGFGDEPSAAYYYIKAKKIVDNPDATKADIVKQLRDSLVAANPGLSDAEIDAKIAEQESQINDTFNALLTRAQSIYNKFDKVLTGAGQGTGDGNPETSYWYEDNNGNIACTNFESFDDTITNDSGYQDILDSLLNGATSSTNPGSVNSNGGATSSSTDLDQCYGSAGALGWILCPVINFVSTATDNIYNNYIQSEFLEVKSENTAVGSDLYKSWQAIRNVANILFIIMFMIVVVSQITGFGISNYGIKKILPRLIVVAVLVNISFLLCQFAVDISNVLGYSFNSLFVGLAPDVTNGMGTLGQVGSGVASALTWAGIAAVAISTAGSWLIPLLLALLSGIVSVIFGGIVLGLRQAGIIILVVLAPAAIVCYALPNAKSFFDRWLKMFTSLLMVFPICGALMGGGYFASNLIVQSTDSVLLSIIAMLIRVAPFFMIPSLVRTSLMAMGNIGNKVANWGNRMGRTATGAIAKSDFVKQRDADLARFQGDMTAQRGRILNRILKKSPDELSDRRKAKIARQYAKYNKLRGEEATAFPYAMSPGSREYTAAQNAAHQKRISTLADNIAAENIDAATNHKELESRLDQAMAAYNESGSDEDLAALQAFDNMLIANGDNGISSIQNSLGRATNAGMDRSVQALGQHLINSHTKDIKPVARELFGAANAAAAGDLQPGSFTQDKDGLFTSLAHLGSSIGGYDASSIGKMNETSLQRMINNAGALKKDSEFVKTFDLLSSNSLTNPNIHVQPKVAEKMNKLRGELGLSQIANNSGTNPAPSNANSSDSGRIQIQGSNGGSGTIVQTGNDNRNSQLPPAVREGNDYRQNDSGIWLPPSR